MSSLSKNYGNAIWTNHALDRLNQRGLTQEMAWKTFQHPESSVKEGESFKYQKKFGRSTVTVIAKQNEKREWLILSCWIYPPLLGTKDYKEHEQFKKYQKSSGFKKFLLTFLRQIGF